MSNAYNNNSWNAWTNKSDGIEFKSTEQAVGDGEQKLGAEFDVKPQGQNVSYDLEVLGEKWEVKKMDSDNSFRLGVEIASDYRKIVDSVMKILDNIISIESRLIESENCKTIKNICKRIKSTSGRTTTLLIEGLRKDEVSAENLTKADDILSELIELVELDDKTLELFSSYDGSLKSYNLTNSFAKLELEDITTVNKLESLECDSNTYNLLLLSYYTSEDLNLFRTETLKEQLNRLVRNIFSDIKLVLVNKTKGYKPLTDLSKIYCNRITSGNPRCKVLET